MGWLAFQEDEGAGATSNGEVEILVEEPESPILEIAEPDPVPKKPDAKTSSQVSKLSDWLDAKIKHQKVQNWLVIWSLLCSYVRKGYQLISH